MRNIIYVVNELFPYQVGLAELRDLLSDMLNSDFLKLGNPENEAYFVDFVDSDGFDADKVDSKADIIHVDFSTLLELNNNFFNLKDANQIKTTIQLDLVNGQIIANHKLLNKFHDVDHNTEDWDDFVVEAVISYNFKSGSALYNPFKLDISDALTLDTIKTVQILQDYGEKEFSDDRNYRNIFSFNAVDNFCVNIRTALPCSNAENYVKNALTNNARKFVEDNLTALMDDLKATYFVLSKV